MLFYNLYKIFIKGTRLRTRDKSFVFNIKNFINLILINLKIQKIIFGHLFTQAPVFYDDIINDLLNTVTK